MEWFIELVVVVVAVDMAVWFRLALLFRDVKFDVYILCIAWLWICHLMTGVNTHATENDLLSDVRRVKFTSQTQAFRILSHFYMCDTSC